jgi:hypothetical protein
MKRPKTRLKKIEQNNLRRKKRKNGGKKSRIFCDEPRCCFSKKKPVFFTPLLTKRPKNAFTKIDKKYFYFYLKIK